MNDGLVQQGLVSSTAGDLISEGKTIQQIKTQYHTAVAVQIERDLVAVEKACIMEASLAGASCFYGWGVGNNRVEGPSIECAMIALRNWGNAALEMQEIHETRQAYIMAASFIDLETGVTYTRQFRQSKDSTIYGKMDDERKADVRFQIGQSKAQRNVILRALPVWLIDKMIEKAKEGVRDKIEKYVQKHGVEKARSIALDALKKFGAIQGRVEAKLGKKYEAWDTEILVMLQGDIKALSDGAESADSLYPSPEAESISSENPSLDEEDMKAGDPNNHQSVKGEKKKSSKQSNMNL